MQQLVWDRRLWIELGLGLDLAWIVLGLGLDWAWIELGLSGLGLDWVKRKLAKQPEFSRRDYAQANGAQQKGLLILAEQFTAGTGRAARESIAISTSPAQLSPA